MTTPSESAAPVTEAPAPVVDPSSFAATPPQSDPSRIGIADRVRARMEAATAPPPEEPVPAPPPAQVVPDKQPTVTAEVPEIEDELEGTKPSAADLGLPIDAPDEDEPADSEPTTPDGRAFKTLRTELKAEKTARLQYEAKVKELETKLTERDASTPEVAELQAKLEEYEKTISISKLELSPAYKAAVEEPYQRVVAKADEYAAQYEIDRYELTEALAIPDRKERQAKLKELLVGVEDFDKLEIIDLGREVEKIAAKQKDLLQNADKALAELEAEQEKAKQLEVAARVAERKTTVAEVIPHMAAKLPSFKDAILGLKSSIEDTDFSSIPVTKQVYNVAAGELLPTVLKDRNRLQRDLESALDELNAIKASAPGSAPGGGASSTKPAPVVEGSFSERIKQRLAGIA